MSDKETKFLVKYIKDKASEYGSIPALAEACGVPKRAIQSALYRKKILALRITAERIREGLKK